MLRPLTADDLDAAGVALAARHAAQRGVWPALPARFEDPAVCAAWLRSVWAAEGVSGAVAVDGGRLTGFVLGGPKPEQPWGPNVWVESAGIAVEDPETARDLYGLAAQRWVDEGRTAHYVVVPAHDRALLDAFARLAFGQQHVHGIRGPLPPDAVRPTPPGVTVRRARRDDVAALARLDLVLPQHQALSPVFSAGRLPTLEEAAAEWEESVDDPAYTTFVAESDGAVVGSAIGCSLELSSLHTGPARPEGAGFLGFAAVLPQARGRGAGRALGEAVLAWSSEQGHPCVVTDWRMTNLQSSRAWPRLGFRPTFVRLHRLVGH